MISISPWFERSFRFDLEPKYFPLVLERLIGTRPRLDALLVGVPAAILIERPGHAWSIQEHVGHLLDLEPLWYGRIGDILAGAAEMRTADLQNRTTWEAGHNECPLAHILEDFSKRRQRLTDRLSALDVEQVSHAARHPRLKAPMRVIDLAFFVAEHDDHHLATIRSRLSASDS